MTMNTYRTDIPPEQLSIQELSAYLDAHPDERPTYAWRKPRRSDQEGRIIQIMGLPGKHYTDWDEWFADWFKTTHRIHYAPQFGGVSLYEYRICQYRELWQMVADQAIWPRRKKLLLKAIEELAQEAEAEKGTRQ